MDSSAGPGPLAQPMASASHSGPHSGPLGAASGLLDDPSGGTRSPRSMRNRRMSADMSAARQMAMIQAGMQPGQDMSADLVSVAESCLPCACVGAPAVPLFGTLRESPWLHTAVRASKARLLGACNMQKSIFAAQWQAG